MALSSNGTECLSITTAIIDVAVKQGFFPPVLWIVYPHELDFQQLTLFKERDTLKSTHLLGLAFSL